MFQNNAKTKFKNKAGLYILIASLVFYFLVKLPFNLSVLCANSNEGFYFIFGQHFLNGTHFDPPGRPYLNLYVLFYSLVLKIFGFNTYSIVALHFIQTLIFILIGVLIYNLMKKIIESSVYSSLAVLFWILFQITPIGQWGNTMELESAFALEAEYFVILFSLSSLFFFINRINNKSIILFSTITGLLSVVAFMFKPSGAVLFLAYCCWFIYIFFFDRRLLDELKINLLFLFVGMVSGILLVNLFIHFVYKIDLIPYWKYYIFVGSYSTDFVKSQMSIFLSVWNFMTRYVNSTGNFIIFLLTFLSIIWSLIRILFFQYENYYHRVLLPLLAILSIGNVCAIIAPGGYSSYYYVLIWPLVAIFLILGLRDILNHIPVIVRKPTIIITTIIFFFCFYNRLFSIYPTYLLAAKNNLQLNVFFQPKSFQDPVLISKNNNDEKRSAVLQTADVINRLLPDKKDTVYIVNFKNKKQYLPVTIYIYMKRLCSSTAVFDYFYYKNYLSDRLEILRKDLISKPPKILILPNVYYLDPWQAEYLSGFLNWINLYVSQNYNFKFNLNFSDKSETQNTIYDVYERN